MINLVIFYGGKAILIRCTHSATRRIPPVKRRNLIVIAAWFFGAILLLFLFFQMQSYAGIINDAGVIRGGTQRVAKMEIAGQHADETAQRIEALLDEISIGENARPFKSQATHDFIEKIDATREQWGLMKDEIAALDAGEGSPERLLEMSERHFELADEMVFAAQARAEQDFLTSFVVGLVLILAVTSLVLFMERNSLRHEKRAYRTDLLTHGKNLAAFEEEAAALVSNAKAETYLVAYSNIFNFRLINESYGHDEGNRIIVSTGRHLEGYCGQGELCAHASADHFVLLLKNTPGRIDEIAADLQKGFQEQSESRYLKVFRHGLGVCEVDKGTSVTEAISNATAALKEGTLVKGVARYDDAFKETLKRRNDIVRHMAEGLLDNQFILYLQPQIDLESYRIVGAEALCRWDSEELGFLYPDSFIPVFEKNGHIVDLDHYMLEKACETYANLDASHAAPATIAVNFSRSTIIQRDFPERLASTAARFGIERNRLEIEITETAFSVDEDAVIDIVKSLRNAGFRIAMDDFGTGYSSLSLLRKLPIDVLKLDRGFISQEQATARETRVLQGIIDLSNDLETATVCEGIETAGQAEALRALGCTIGQGYLFARPMPASEFASFSKSWSETHETRR